MKKKIIALAAIAGLIIGMCGCTGSFERAVVDAKSKSDLQQCFLTK